MAKNNVTIMIVIYCVIHAQAQNLTNSTGSRQTPSNQFTKQLQGQLKSNPALKFFGSKLSSQSDGHWLAFGQPPGLHGSALHQEFKPGSKTSGLPFEHSGAGPFELAEIIRSRYNELFAPAGASPQADTVDYALPDISHISEMVPTSGFFHSFSPVHIEAMREVSNIMRGANSTEELLDVAKALRQSEHIHPHLWFYSFSTVANKNPELAGLQSLSPIDALPHMFINSEALEQARENPPQTCVVIDESFGADNGIENRLWYFREHIGINAHHWYYHISYPISAPTRQDRRGELFYYLHASMLARYNAERLSNGLSRTRPIEFLQRGVPLQGYNSHLTDDVSGVSWTPRGANQPLNDLFHENNPAIGYNIYLDATIVEALMRIVGSINDGFLVSAWNEIIPLNNINGIDMLVDVIESNMWSVNQAYYGAGTPSGLHADGHRLIAFQADPLYRLMLPPGVMLDTSTSMRDPIFYQWHVIMEEIFLAHKATLKPYTPTGGELPLIWPGVSVTNISISTKQNGTINKVNTFWGQQSIRLSRTLDLGVVRDDTNPLQICAKQLDHEPFTYNIAIDTGNNAAANGTVRIFLAPRFDESGNRWSMTDQRRQFFVLDTYGVRLNTGMNYIRRQSSDSTLTVPWSQHLQQLNTDPGMTTPRCGCGWPQNMLLPKGTPSGMVFDLFVMVTNRLEDTVPGQDIPGPCIPAPLYCGITNQLYPDAKPMGYPFDRLPYSVNQNVVANLEEYVQEVPNMGTTQIKIRFTG